MNNNAHSQNISNIEKEYVPQDSLIKKYINQILITSIDKIIYSNKLITSLQNRIKTLETKIQINEIAEKLNKHYEQSRRC